MPDAGERGLLRFARFDESNLALMGLILVGDVGILVIRVGPTCLCTIGLLAAEVSEVNELRVTRLRERLEGNSDSRGPLPGCTGLLIVLGFDRRWRTEGIRSPPRFVSTEPTRSLTGLPLISLSCFLCFLFAFSLITDRLRSGINRC